MPRSKSTAEPYQPREGSLAWQVINFLAANPEEELTTKDIVAKFDVPYANISLKLNSAHSAGAIVLGEGEDGEQVWKLGNGKPAPASERQHHQLTKWLGGGSKAKPRSPVVSRTVLQSLDLSAIDIEDNVPMPSAKLALDWLGLFNRMQPGQSAKLPLEAKSALAKAMTDFKKSGAGEIKRHTADDHIRIWRLA
jgi:hypothetical protein